MDPAVWNKIKDAFDAATALADDERELFLLDQPEETRCEILRLLAADRKAGSFILEPAVVDLGISKNSDEINLCGTKIDEYELLKEIGHGGMGTVYLASRHGDFDKNVALKLIKRGMDTSAVLKRFVMERQILARLEHPNIARLLDGGTTSDGLPYFVMEYVEGEPITKFCNKQQLSIDERLELFRKVCSAISYAHQNLVVHRDIKPSNILVTSNGTPKLLDFGIAKLLHPDWSLDTNEATATMFRVMTPEYASPEQIRGLPITTASDVYSLGVVLYELLSGERPYKFERATPAEIERIVLTDEPVKPSSVVSPATPQKDETKAIGGQPTGEDEIAITEAGKPPHNSRSAPRNLRGDLDNIVLKALRKEPERRYQSVQEFSEDIRRHLIGLPVTASADTFSYRAGKFVRRHRAGALAAALIFLTLVTATAVTTWQAYVARRERDQAEQRFNQVRELANIILFDYYDKIKDLPGTVELREQLVSDALRYLDNLSQSKVKDISLQRDLAKAYEKIGEVQFGLSNGNLGNSTGALESYQKALNIAENITENNDATDDDYLNLANLYVSMGGVTGETGDIHDDIAMKQKAVGILEKLAAGKPEKIELQDNLAKVYWYLGTPLTIVGDDDAAKASFEKAGEIYQQLSQVEPQNLKHKRNIALTDKYLAQLLTRQLRFKEALELLNHAMEIDKSRELQLPDEAQVKYDVSATYYRMGECFLAMQDFAGAERSFNEARAIREVLAAKDPNNAYFRDFLTESYYGLGLVWTKTGKPLKAAEILVKAIDLLEISLRADQSDVFNQIRLAQYKTSLGNADMSLARDTHEPLNVRRDRLNNARANFEEGAGVWEKLQKRNAVPKYNEAEITDTRTMLDECEKALSELSS